MLFENKNSALITTTYHHYLGSETRSINNPYYLNILMYRLHNFASLGLSPQAILMRVRIGIWLYFYMRSKGKYSI